MVKSTFFDIIDTAWPTLVIFLIVIIMLRIMYLKQNIPSLNKVKP